MTLFLSR